MMLDEPFMGFRFHFMSASPHKVTQCNKELTLAWRKPPLVPDLALHVRLSEKAGDFYCSRVIPSCVVRAGFIVSNRRCATSKFEAEAVFTLCCFQRVGAIRPDKRSIATNTRHNNAIIPQLTVLSIIVISESFLSRSPRLYFYHRYWLRPLPPLSPHSALKNNLLSTASFLETRAPSSKTDHRCQIWLGLADFAGMARLDREHKCDHRHF